MYHIKEKDLSNAEKCIKVELEQLPFYRMPSSWCEPHSHQTSDDYSIQYSLLKEKKP